MDKSLTALASVAGFKESPGIPVYQGLQARRPQPDEIFKIFRAGGVSRGENQCSVSIDDFNPHGCGDKG